MVNGDLNIASLDQSGSDNSALVDAIGSSNRLSISQTGTLNDAVSMASGDSNQSLIDQIGSFNTATVSQIGNSNAVSMTFQGDSNGGGTLTGVAGLLVSTSGGQLVSGSALQDSSSALSGNSLTYTVVGNLNQFAFAQVAAATRLRVWSETPAPPTATRLPSCRTGRTT